MKEPIDVAITIDTECSIGGAFADPDRYSPIGMENVYCTADSKQNGLPFLVETFDRFGLNATFFVETMQTSWFGSEPMAEAVRDIRAAGQDVQLHLHPCWSWFRDAGWKQRLRSEQPSDNCTLVDEDVLAGFVADGIETFAEWGLDRPVAFRTGGLNASRSVYRALARNGIALASNVGFAYAPSPEPELHLSGGVHEIEGVIEVPVRSYVEFEAFGGRRDRLLSITSTSFEETRSLLEQAHIVAQSPVVILTHPFEFVKTAPAGREGVRRNRINQNRLISLCRFLASSPDRFRVTTFTEGLTRWSAPGNPVAELRVPLHSAIKRMASNKLNDMVPAL